MSELREIVVMLLPLMVLFAVKVVDNILNTTKTIMIQRNQSVIAGMLVVVSQLIYFTIVKSVVSSGSMLTTVVVSIAAGYGTFLALKIGDRYSKDKMYIHVLMSDDREVMRAFRDYLAETRVTNTATVGYTLDWEETIQITVYAETKAESKAVDKYIEENEVKVKRVVYN